MLSSLNIMLNNLVGKKNVGLLGILFAQTKFISAGILCYSGKLNHRYFYIIYIKNDRQLTVFQG